MGVLSGGLKIKMIVPIIIIVPFIIYGWKMESWGLGMGNINIILTR